jgi:peptidoglycan/LPS O-acetylase OafA/YrhL
LGYYAVFFAFGVLYFEADDAIGRLGRSWRWTFPVSLLVVFPAALEFATGTFGLRDKLLPVSSHRPASIVLQALYAWTMSFAWMGLFRSLLNREIQFVRYMSEASYWFYLVHLPLVIIVQTVISKWPLPALLKFLMACTFVTLILLLSYNTFVRYSLIGSFLNGRRGRHAQQTGVTATVRD